MRGEKESKYARRKQEEIVMKRKIKPPDGIALCISSIPGARFGACSLKNIPVGTWFGPFEGKLVRPNESICGANSEFMWEVRGFITAIYIFSLQTSQFTGTKMARDFASKINFMLTTLYMPKFNYAYHLRSARFFFQLH